MRLLPVLASALKVCLEPCGMVPETGEQDSKIVSHSESFVGRYLLITLVSAFSSGGVIPRVSTLKWREKGIVYTVPTSQHRQHFRHNLIYSKYLDGVLPKQQLMLFVTISSGDICIHPRGCEIL